MVMSDPVSSKLGEEEKLCCQPVEIPGYGLVDNSSDSNKNIKIPKSKTSENGEEKKPNCYRRFLARRPYWVEPAFFLFELSLWSQVPLVNQYIYYRVAAEVEPILQNATEERSVQIMYFVDSYTSSWVLYLELLRSIPSVISTLIILSFGDVIGRKLGLFLPCIGGTIKSVVYLVTSYYDISLYCLVAGHMAEGLCGTQLTMSGSAYAYLADIVPKEKRAFRYIMLNAVLLGGITCGNVIVGYLITIAGFSASFLYSIVIFVASGLYILIFVPESLQKKDKEISALQIIKESLKSLKIYTVPRMGHFSRTRLIICLVILMITALTLMGLSNVQTLYLIAPPFNFSPVKLGYFMALGAILNAVGPLLAVLILQKYCSNITIGMLGAVSGIVGFIIFGLAVNDIMVFIAPFGSMFMAAILPIVRAIMSNSVAQHEQGALQASISCLNTINDVLGITIHVGIYSATVTFFSGLIFILTAGMFAIVLVLFIILWWLERKYPTADTTILID